MESTGRSHARVGKAVRRRGTPIPVLPPRVPTPVPPPDARSTPPPPSVIETQSSRAVAQMAHQYLENNVKAWINPRIYAKVDQEAVKSVDYVFTPKTPHTTTNGYHYYPQYPYNVNTHDHNTNHHHHHNHHTSSEYVMVVNKCHASPQRALVSPGHAAAAKDQTVPPRASVSPHGDANTAHRMKQHRSPAPVLANGHHRPAALTTFQQPAVPPTPVLANGHHQSAGLAKTSKVNQASVVTNGGYQQKPQCKGHHHHHTHVGLDLFSAVGTSSTSSGPAAAAPGFYSETKYAYSVSGVPGTPAQSSAAAAFFARAAQKLNLSSPHRRKRHSSGDDDAVTSSGFSAVIHRSPPPVPPALLRRIGVKEVTGVGKVKVMLRVSGGAPQNGSVPDTNGAAPSSTSSSFFSIDARKKQVTLFDPAACGGSSAPEDRRVGVAAPKMFAFDAIFSQDDSQTEVCSSALTDVIHAVINGTDGCLFCFGHARLGKTYTMVGTHESVNTLGVIPCAISWLFRGINEQKQKTGARFSVRVSAVEVSGPSQHLKDLLAGHANDSEQSPGVYLRDDPLFGTQLQNQSELRVPSAEKAAFYLDAAISSRGLNRDDSKDSHLLYTLHVYQYSVAGRGGVAGGRSRLHLIDLGSCERGKANGGIPLSGLGNVLLAIFNGQKHLPYREHKVTQLLKECLSSLTCHAAMIAHVSPFAQHYTDTLATVQLASRIHRMRRRKIKFGGGSAGSGGSSGEEAARLQAQENGRSTGSSDVDPSSSEQSADTVIYVGPSDDATDGEHPPVYIPSLNSGDNRCAMGKALRGSGAEHRPNTVRTHQNHTGKTTLMTATSTKPINQKIPNGTLVDDRGSPSHRSNTTKTSGQLSTSAVKTNSSGHSSSCKSSPVRTPSKSASNKASTVAADQQQVSIQNSKIPVPFSNTNGGVSGSDEQWIDGPRISKSKVAEARNLLKDSHKKKETWIDGPLQSVKIAGNGHASGSYGFMDNHKKSMIRKWVENQTVQIQKQHTGKHVPSAGQRPPTTGAAEQVQPRDLTSLRVGDDASSENEDCRDQRQLLDGTQVNVKTPSECDVVLYGDNVTYDFKKGVDSKTGDRFDEMRTSEQCERVCDVDGEEDRTLAEVEESEDGREEEEEEVEEEEEDEREDEGDEGMGRMPPALQLLHPHNKEISIDVSMDSFDVRLLILQDQRDSGSGVGDDEEVEIIEVEEPYEPVPMQDSCLQVTEEDIALCMGEMENPLPEVDQESAEEHPLRILSQENLTVVSTFTDSLSVTTDMDRTLPRHRFGLPPLSDHPFHPHRPYSLYELPDEYIGHHTDLGLYPEDLKQKHDSDMDHRELLSSQSRFDQLARLHEMYKNKLARANVSKPPSPFQSPQYRPPSRCQSLSLSDMLYGTGCNENPNMGMGYTGNSSIYSEPAYNHHRPMQNQSKICDNCKMSFSRTGSSTLWYQPVLSQSRDHLVGHNGMCNRDSHRFCSKGLSGGCNISSLRHPDGASNPNLKEEVERVPGNGASTSDHEEEEGHKRVMLHEDIRTVTGKANDEEEDDEPPPVLPPPLPAPASSRLHRRLFGKVSSRLKSAPGLAPEGYDSGHDSSSPRPIKVAPLSARLVGKPRPGCESSGYESVVRDSESSSFGSSQDSDNGSRVELHDPGGANKVPVLQYCREDVERLERRWTEVRGSRIRELRQEQGELKKELAAAKTRLLIPSSRWSYELHVEASMDHRDPSFVEALQRETQILRKRVEACKSHIIMVTCFDALPRPED